MQRAPCRFGQGSVLYVDGVGQLLHVVVYVSAARQTHLVKLREKCAYILVPRKLEARVQLHQQRVRALEKALAVLGFQQRAETGVIARRDALLHLPAAALAAKREIIRGDRKDYDYHEKNKKRDVFHVFHHSVNS